MKVDVDFNEVFKSAFGEEVKDAGDVKLRLGHVAVRALGGNEESLP